MNAAPARALGAGVAVVVLAALPLLVAAPKAEERTAATGTLTIELSGDAGGVDPYVIQVAGPSPTPVRASTLRDGSGRYTATVTPQPGTCVPDSQRVAFTDGRTPWCLQLTNVRAGHEVVGTVANEQGDTLTLTVRRRDGFMPRPLAVLLLGLFAGVLIALVPRWLRALVRWLILNRMINQADSAAGERRIEGLKDWVGERRAEGESREVLITAVHRVTSSGPEQAQRARRRLQTVIGEVAHTEHPLVTAAQGIANNTTNKMSDFYVDGEERKTHPADDGLRLSPNSLATVPSLTRRSVRSS
jgi:hypothetical protein